MQLGMGKQCYIPRNGIEMHWKCVRGFNNSKRTRKSHKAGLSLGWVENGWKGDLRKVPVYFYSRLCCIFYECKSFWLNFSEKTSESGYTFRGHTVDINMFIFLCFYVLVVKWYFFYSSFRNTEKCRSKVSAWPRQDGPFAVFVRQKQTLATLETDGGLGYLLCKRIFLCGG